MASNDALLLSSLLGVHTARDGSDPFGFTRGASVVKAAGSTHRPHAVGPPTRRAEFVATNDLDGALYTPLLQSVTGIDPLRVYTGAPSACGVAAVATSPTQVGRIGSLFVTMQVFHLGEPLTPVLRSSASLGPRRRAPLATPDASAAEEGAGAVAEEVFDERIVVPLSVASLPLDCEVRCRVYSTEQGLVGVCAYSPFSLEGELQSGYRRLRLFHPAAESGGGEREPAAVVSLAEYDRHLCALHRGLLPAVPWLDAVTRQHLMSLRRTDSHDEGAGERSIPGAFLHLHLPVPSRALPLLSLTDPMDALTAWRLPLTPSSLSAMDPGAAAYHPSITLPYVDHYRVLKDSNVCEGIAAIVARSTLLLYDAHATPGVAERERLSQLASRPPLQLQPLRVEDVALLWRYRHFITRDGRLFVPFMSSVEWRSMPRPAPARHRAGDAALDTRQQQQHSAEWRVACDLIPRWRPLELSQVLACLSATFRGVGPVRQHAARLLDREGDELLCWAALQLVQSLRYDSTDGEPEMATLLLRRALGSWELCAALHWGALVEGGLSSRAQTPSPIAAFRAALEEAVRRSHPAYLARLRRQRELCSCLRALHTKLNGAAGDRTSRIAQGQRLLGKRACGFGELFLRSRAGAASTSAAPNAEAAGAPIDERSRGSSTRSSRGNSTRAGSAPSTAAAAGSEAALGGALDEPGAVTLPTHPTVIATGVNPEAFYLFKSAKQPMQVGFLATVCAEGGHSRRVFSPLAMTAPATASASLGGEEVRLIYKVNDDVRQDQLIVQLLHWVDALLRQDGLDLCLTPYRVLATGAMEGLVEVVPDVVTFQSVQRDALRYLRVHNPTSEALRLAMDRYTRSFAGYSVFTFVLGIGDRHLENILLAKDGRLLHIDFGYILGQDPKPFPPPMKISREMLEVLGGPESAGYTEFKTYCCMAYNILRKHAALLLNLLLLMGHAEGLPQLTGDSAAGGEGGTTGRAKEESARADPRVSMAKVQEKLRLDLSNAQATQYIQNVIADSVGSVFTGLWDVLHAAAQATRV